MVVDAAGLFVTQRKRPELAVVQPSFTKDGQLTLTTPGGSVQVQLEITTGTTASESAGERRSVEVCGRWMEGGARPPRSTVEAAAHASGEAAVEAVPRTNMNLP